MDLKSLEALGITADSLIDRIVNKCAEELLTEVNFDEEGDEWRNRSRIARELDKRIKDHIDATVSKIADQHVLPKVGEFIEGLTLTQTNQWGEKRGETVTFVEYLTQRAGSYMCEEVNHNGKSKAEEGYSWSKHSTRITYEINRHLQYSIEIAMKQALKDANSQIAKGLEGAVKLALESATAKLKVAVTAA